MTQNIALTATQESAVRVLATAPFAGYRFNDACQTLALAQSLTILSAHLAINALVEFGMAHTYKTFDGVTLVGLTVEGAELADRL